MANQTGGVAPSHIRRSHFPRSSSRRNQYAQAGVPFCGWWGRLKSNDVLPFILLKNGRVDFGSDDETDQDTRFGHLDIHGRHLDHKEHVTYKDEDEVIVFRVGSSTDLLD